MRLILRRNQIIIISVKVKVWIVKVVHWKHIIRLMAFSKRPQILNRGGSLITFNLSIWENSDPLKVVFILFANIIWLFLQIEHVYSLSIMHFM